MAAKDLAMELSDSSINNAIGSISPHLAKAKMDLDKKQRRMGLEDLTEYVKEHAPNGKTTKDDSEKFFHEIDFKVTIINKDFLNNPLTKNIVGRILPYVAASYGTWWSWNAGTNATEDKKKLLTDAASYVAHKVSGLIEQERLASTDKSPGAAL